MLGRWLQDGDTALRDLHSGIKGQITAVYLDAHDLGAPLTRLVQGIFLGIYFYFERIGRSQNAGASQYGVYTAVAHAGQSLPFLFGAILRVSIIDAASEHGREFTGFIDRPAGQWRGMKIMQIGFITGDDALAGTQEAFEALFLLLI